MSSEEKRVFYRTSNTYTTLNQLDVHTENIWFCCHGMGYLSRYFINYFKSLDQDKNYVIAPQAPSKYYQDNKFKYIGASWLTRENTKQETENILCYFDEIYDAENIQDKSLILFGFSQGVSVSLRWLAKRKMPCKMLVLYAGGIPKELKPKDFDFLKNTQVKIIYGKHDEYVTVERLKQEIKRAKSLFEEEYLEFIEFNGTHEMRSEIIKDLSSKIG